MAEPPNTDPGPTPVPGVTTTGGITTATGPLTGPLTGTGGKTRAARITQLGRYRIEKTLGVGGSATVFLANDTTIDKKVALKVLHEHLRQDSVTVRRFANDARALARLNHPHIVQVFAAELDQYYFAMELVEGTDLARLIAQHGSLPAPRAAAIALQVAEALAHIHAIGLLHRDVKPGNILIAPGDRVKMTDFSVVRETGETCLTLSGSLVGTVEYMAPEQIREEDAGERADIYALGAVLYEMLVGRPPFTRDASTTDLWPLMERILKTDPVAPQAADSSVPQDISDLVMRALRKNPADRPATMTAVADELRAIVGGTTTMFITPVALAEPVENDGRICLSWTSAASPEFDRYEVLYSSARDFPAAATTILDTVRDREQTQANFAAPAGGGLRYYRIRSIERGGLTSVSNRVSFTHGKKPALWKRRHLQVLFAAAMVFAMIAAWVSRPQAVPLAGLANAAGGPVTAEGNLSMLRYQADGSFRGELSTVSLVAGAKRSTVPKLIVAIPADVVKALDADGFDPALLVPQSATVTGEMTYLGNDPLVTVTARDDITLATKAREPQAIEAAQWEQSERKTVRLTARVTNVNVSASQLATITLQGGVKVVMFKEVTGRCAAIGIDLEGLAGKTVAVTGRVNRHQTYGLQLIVARPEHLVVN